jgi:L-ribulokinase
MSKLVIGIDFGTDSCRALIVDTVSGNEMATHIAYYSRWKNKLYCDASNNQYRQHPQDYIDSLEEAVKGALQQLPHSAAAEIAGLGIDTTGSTPCITDKYGNPLALLPEYADNPNAMFILWKDHTSIDEAEEITQLAHKWKIDYTSRSGGIYSSEWYWAKALHVLRTDETIRKVAYSIIEHCDWMSALLTGNLKPEEVKRSRCAAGHKGMWAEEWGGYPSQEFLSELDTLFDGFAYRLNSQTYTSDVSAGKLSEEWAQRLGIPSGIDVAVGIIDAHAGAIGSEIKENTMVKNLGTSTCDIVVSPKSKINDRLIPGISGQVDGSVIPDLI